MQAGRSLVRDPLPIRADPDRLCSNRVARSPDEDNEDADQKKYNEHPVLALEAKKAKFLNEKLHCARPFPVQFIYSA
jgi:hypothetical protein